MSVTLYVVHICMCIPVRQCTRAEHISCAVPGAITRWYSECARKPVSKENISSEKPGQQ